MGRKYRKEKLSNENVSSTKAPREEASRKAEGVRVRSGCSGEPLPCFGAHSAWSHPQDAGLRTSCSCRPTKQGLAKAMLSSLPPSSSLQ